MSAAKQVASPFAYHSKSGRGGSKETDAGATKPRDVFRTGACRRTGSALLGCAAIGVNLWFESTPRPVCSPTVEVPA